MSADIHMSIRPPESFSDEVRIAGHGSNPPLMLTMTFRHMGKAESRAWLETVSASTELRASEALMDIVCGMILPSGEVVSASVEIFEQMHNDYPNPFPDIVTAWLRALSGEREKN